MLKAVGHDRSMMGHLIAVEASKPIELQFSSLESQSKTNDLSLVCTLQSFPFHRLLIGCNHLSIVCEKARTSFSAGGVGLDPTAQPKLLSSEVKIPNGRSKTCRKNTTSSRH